MAMVTEGGKRVMYGFDSEAVGPPIEQDYLADDYLFVDCEPLPVSLSLSAAELRMLT